MAIANVGNTLANSMFQVRSAGRTRLNFIPGTNVTISVNDDSAGDRANVSISAFPGISVKQYGATGDGVTDDAPFINTALTAAAAAGVATVFLPSGTYRIASIPVLMTPGTCLLGEGADSILKQGNAANLDAVVDFSGYLGGVAATGATIRNLTVDGNRDNNTSQMTLGTNKYLVYYGNTDHVTIDGNWIQNGVGYGISGSSQYGLTVSDNTITNTEAHQIFCVKVGTNFVGDIRIFNNVLDNMILVGGCTGVLIDNNMICGTLIGDAGSPMRVSVANTAVTWVSGPDFTNVKVGMTLIADNGTVQTEIKNVNSTTSLTLKDSQGTHTNKLAMIGTNDLIGLGAITRGVVTNNIVREGCSFGLSLYSSSVQLFENVILSNNYMYRQGKQGFVLLGDDGGGGIGAQNVLISDNMVMNACQGGLAGNPSGGGGNHSFFIAGGGITRVVLDNNFSEDDLSLTYSWLGTYGSTDAVILGQNYQVSAQNDGIYAPDGYIQQVAATNITIGDVANTVIDTNTKFVIKTSINEDVAKFYGPSGTHVSYGFFGTTAYWQSNGGNIEIGTETAHELGLRTNTVVRLKVGSAGDVTVRPDVATPANGSTSARLLFGTTSGFGFYYGSGTPTVSAGQGSIYLRSDGANTTTRLYVNKTGSTTWASVSTTS